MAIVVRLNVPDYWFTQKQAASLLGTSFAWVYTAVALGLLEGEMDSVGELRIPPLSLEGLRRKLEVPRELKAS